MSEPIDTVDAPVVRPGLLIRQLTSSDLGLFYAKRPEIQSKQRAININADVAGQMLSRGVLEHGSVVISCRRSDIAVAEPEARPLHKSGKNWRLGGNAIRDVDFRRVNPGDLFIGEVSTSEHGEPTLNWRIVFRESAPQLHKELISRVSLKNGMAFVPAAQSHYADLHALAFRPQPEPEKRFDGLRERPSAAIPPAPKPTDGIGARPKAAIPPAPRPLTVELGHQRRPRGVKERIRSPYIMEEMLQVAGGLSSRVQHEFFETVTRLAEMLRETLLEHKLIQIIPRNHRAAWHAVRHKLIAHVDGGMANIPALGAAPVAIRVGTYMVRPGMSGDNRESFLIRPQLVDELFATSGSGIFNGLYPDMGAVRDAARMATEAAGAVEVVAKHPDVDYLLIHGALVNPVSRYSDMEDEEGQTVPFPSFSPKALDLLLPFKSPKPSGDDAQFIPVYLEQLLRLKSAPGIVCGVVERPGHSVAVSSALLGAMSDHTLAPLVPEPPDKWRAWFQLTMKQLGIGDALLFRCVLEEGEATVPVAVDRNDLRRAPPKWKRNGTIAKYPPPYVSYIVPSEWAGPVRAEIFEQAVPRFPEIANFLMHSSMLLPGYAFPVGLDTADKLAKVPNWMGRPVTARMMVTAFKRALDSGNDKQINALRHLLCGTERDFFFRPKP